ncbi:hypothetical protein [Microbacterium sp. K24]|uniref:hypothetical protein n=1 Tax=Microbacterium sp. K24 TaxID=2305446 RepID=UPI00109D7EDE|nr:hypothetical protein [Microbacterium sp. K24]
MSDTKETMGAVARAELDRAITDLRHAVDTLENPFAVDFYGDAVVRFDAVDADQLREAILVAISHLEVIS